jgi:lycopene cyclase domain-containing protein
MGDVPAYTALTVVAVVVVVVVDLRVLRTRLLLRRSFWVALAIMWSFQVFVDGWLTRARDTIVSYDDAQTLGVRVFFNTPVEDFAYGFALILLTLSVWDRLGRERPRGAP